MEPKEIPSRLIFRLLVVSTWQLEILVTTLFWVLILLTRGLIVVHVVQGMAKGLSQI